MCAKVNGTRQTVSLHVCDEDKEYLRPMLAAWKEANKTGLKNGYISVWSIGLKARLSGSLNDTNDCKMDM